MKGLTDIPGIKVGHASDYEGLTGCTVVLCEGGAVGGVDIRGSASETASTDPLRPGHIAGQVHAIVLTGGSAFGLEAASGVRKHLEHRGIGFDMRSARIPIVPCAVLYDLSIGKPNARPTREMGEAAAVAANDGSVKEGAVGAGTGATVGKLFGMQRAMKGGVGSFTAELSGGYSGVLVSALAAVNAVGDVIDPVKGGIVAGARVSAESRDFANSALALKRGLRAAARAGNTTLITVATNARLTKLQAAKLAQYAQHGMVRAISPVHMMGDGDTVFALSVGNKQADVDALGVAAAEAVAQAIVRAVQYARTLGGVPGLASE